MRRKTEHGSEGFCSHLRTTHAALLMVVARAAILCIPFRIFSPLLGMHMHDSPTSDAGEHAWAIAEVCRSVDVAATWVPWAATCLTRAVAIKLMLGRRRCPSTLYLGVRVRDNTLFAHAWLRAGNRIVSGAQEAMNFTPVAWFT